MNIVEKKFSKRGIQRPGGWAIYSKENALEFIRECKKQSIKILGIDGFFIHIQPSMENSVDYSDNQEKVNEIYSLAEQFVLEKKDDMFFEIVCDD